MYKVHIRAVAKNLIFIYKLSRGVPRSPLQVALPSGAQLQSLGIYSLSALCSALLWSRVAQLAIRALRPREVYVLCTRSRVATPPAAVGVGIVKHLKRALTCPPKTPLHNAIHCYSQRPSTIGCTSSTR